MHFPASFPYKVAGSCVVSSHSIIIDLKTIYNSCFVSGLEYLCPLQSCLDFPGSFPYKVAGTSSCASPYMKSFYNLPLIDGVIAIRKMDLCLNIALPLHSEPVHETILQFTIGRRRDSHSQIEFMLEYRAPTALRACT